MNDWIGHLLDNWGYWGVAFLMFVETVFPPIPSEVIMPLAGVNVAQQGGSLAGVVLAGTAGAMAGNIFWFALAWKLGLDRFEGFLVRYGRIFTMDEEEIAKGRALFDRYGAGFVGVGRIIPTIRSLISVPAGLVRMNVRTFMIYSTLGTFLWTMGLTLAGYYLGRNFDEIDRILGPLSTGVILICFGIYLVRVIMWNRWKRKKPE
ncbi:DedA family protein [Sandaracinobacter neustonicus]|uniref:DedA family protein n=1 Tax=Sandaracinobacter neustonicus TaxID=1715348 RepID=A0A501XM55_9SPHN|nr:DedA family protein [Sandaracinobacter neustonicus]TPE61761.1 DedA family protein [Sandaracinobacter neustonicus]